MATSRDPEREDGKIGQEPTETTQATPPEDTGNQDAEPEEDEIPHSAKALADYHDDLQDLHEAFQHHHGALHEEMSKRYKMMEHPEVKPIFEKMLAGHKDEMQRHSDFMGAACKDLHDAFEQHHPDLVPPDEAETSQDKETKVPANDRGTKEKVESRTAKEEEGTGPGKSTTATTPNVPVQTKAAGAANEDLDEHTLQMILSMAERFEGKQISQQKRLEKELIGSK